MSVTLEGNVDIVDCEYNWSGEWQFSKDKKTALKFAYSWLSGSVERELLDYVSFANEAPITPVSKKSKSSKLSRGRGRPPLTLIEASENATVNASICSPIVEQTLVETEDVSVCEQIVETVLAEQITTSDTPNDNVPTNGVDNITNVNIERSHPLLGMWKGSFDIRSKVTDAESFEAVPEVFFFYSLFDGAVSKELEGLPPSPQFPFGLLEKSASPDKVECATVMQEVVSVDVAASNASLFSVDPVAAAVLEKEGGVTAAAVSDKTADVSEVNSSQVALPSDASDLVHTVTLVGFGRNMFGRFSVAAIYNEITHEMKCEKKYLVSKFASKRGRKSVAESSSSIAAVDEEGDVEGLLGRQQLRPKQMGGGSSVWDPSLGLDGCDGASKRKRNSLGTSSSKVVVSPSVKPMFATSSSLPAFKGYSPKDAMSFGVGGAAPSGYVLTGSRDPDSDDPHGDYREAFQDCDTGEIYEGGWAYGARYGRGVCLYNDGLLYEGNWLQNKEHGKGQLMTADRRVIYTGDWLDGCFHGVGTYYFGNGDSYTGDWRESSRQGRGEYIFRNGCRYSGDWRDNKRAGRGLFVWPDESFYDGDWEAERRHGRGVLELSNGLRYDGGWAHNLMEGKGCCTFPSGQIYQGTYKSGLREGRGSVLFAEGAVYEGRFKEDRLDGQGTLKISDSVPGAEADELMFPVQIQAELWRIHLKAGFGTDSH